MNSQPSARWSRLGLCCVRSRIVRARVRAGGPKGIWHTDVLLRRVTHLPFEGWASAIQLGAGGRALDPRLRGAA